MLFYLVLVIHLLADGRLQHQAHLSVVDAQNLADDFVREVVDYQILIVLPDDDRLLLEVHAHQLSVGGQVQVFDGIVIGLSIEDGLCVVFEFPAFDSLVADTVVLVGFTVAGNDLFEVFFIVGERPDLLAALLRAQRDLVIANFAVGVAVDVRYPGQLLYPVVSFLQLPYRVDLQHVVGPAPEKVHLGGGVDGLDDGDL